MNKISDAVELPNDNISGYKHLTVMFCENNSIGLSIGIRSILRILAMYTKYMIYFDRRKLSEYSTESAYDAKKFHYKAFRHSSMSTSEEWFMSARPISVYKFMVDKDKEEDDE